MRYVRRVLQPGETVVYDTKLHSVIYTRAILLLVGCAILAGAAVSVSNNQNLSLALEIAAGILALLALSTAFRAFVRRATTELAVTDHRVIYKTGLLSRHTIEINRLENEGDRISREAVASLFDGGIDPMVVIRWKDIYERLESAIDATERVANILEGIIIKNS